MKNTPWTTMPDKEKDRALAAYEAKDDATLQEISRQYGVKTSTLRRNLRSYRGENKLNYKETFEQKEDGSVFSDKLIEICEEDLKSPERILELHGLDPDKFDVVSYVNNRWHMGSVQQYQSKLNARPKKFVLDEETINRIYASLKPRKTVKALHNAGDLLIVPIADLHYGLIGKASVCGEDYDMDIAEQRVDNVLAQVKGKAKDIGRIWLVIGNDFLNSDNLQKTTTAGTPQDTYDFWFDLINKACDLVIHMIDELSQIAEVEVVYVPSNHDEHSMFSVMKVADAYFDGIDIDTSPLYRKYRKYGNALFMFTHDAREKDILNLMTTEAKDSWSECEQFYCMMAHKHTEQFMTDGYVQIFRFPTISGVSRWSYNKGYVTPHRKTQCFTVSEKYGIIDTWNMFV